MPKKLLSIQDIKKLNKLLRQVFKYIANLRTENRLADKIQYPKLPPMLTESLALHLLKKKMIVPELNGFDFELDGKDADILATKKSQKIKIEVKATGERGFQELGEKDISADYLLWFHFDKFYRNSKDTNIEIYIVKKPNNYFKRKQKMYLPKFKEIIGEKLKEIDFNINSL